MMVISKTKKKGILTNDLPNIQQNQWKIDEQLCLTVCFPKEDFIIKKRQKYRFLEAYQLIEKELRKVELHSPNFDSGSDYPQLHCKELRLAIELKI